MRVYVHYEDTNNEYDIPMDRLLKLLDMSADAFESAVLKVLQEG